MKTSPYILARILGGENRMALSAQMQRNLYKRVNRLVLLCEDLLLECPFLLPPARPRPKAARRCPAENG